MQEATQSLQKDSSHLHYLVTTELNIQNVWINLRYQNESCVFVVHGIV